MPPPLAQGGYGGGGLSPSLLRYCARAWPQIMTERVQGLERELNSREAMLRQRESRLVSAEEQLGALTAEAQGLKVKLKSVRGEAQRREENIRSALKSLANAKAENIELKVRGARCSCAMSDYVGLQPLTVVPLRAWVAGVAAGVGCRLPGRAAGAA